MGTMKNGDELYLVLKASLKNLPTSFYRQYRAIFQEEHLLKLAERLNHFYKNGFSEYPPEPHFELECTPLLSDSYRFFKEALESHFSQKISSEDSVKGFAQTFYQAGCHHILLLLGQRLTPASLTDVQAIPPILDTLLKSANQIYNQDLTVAARALDKHASRYLEAFWQSPSGSTAVKNKIALEKVEKILKEATWWNCFIHYEHGKVFEWRAPSGHGVRWKNEGREFIGFLEPFLKD